MSYIKIVIVSSNNESKGSLKGCLKGAHGSKEIEECVFCMKIGLYDNMFIYYRMFACIKKVVKNAINVCKQQGNFIHHYGKVFL